MIMFQFSKREVITLVDVYKAFLKDYKSKSISPPHSVGEYTWAIIQRLEDALREAEEA